MIAYLKENKWVWPLCLLTLATFIGYWNMLLLSPLQPFIAFDLEISIPKAVQLTTVSSAAATAVLMILFFSGRYGALISRRVLIWIGIACLTFGSFLLTKTDDYALMMLIRVFNGIADGIIYPAAWVAVFDYLPEKRRQTGIAWVVIGTSLSAVIGLPITCSLIGNGDWQKSISWFALISFGILVITLLLPEAVNRQVEFKLGGWQILLKDPKIRIIALANICGDIAWFGALLFLGSFLVRFYNPSLWQLSVFYFMGGLSFVLGCLWSMPTPALQRRIAMYSSLIVVVMALIFFSISRGFWLSVGLAVVYGFTRAPGIVAMDTMLMEVSEKKVNLVIVGALTNLISSFAILGVAAVGGMVLGATTYQGIGVAFAVFSLIAFFLLWLMKPLGLLEEG